MINFRFSWWGAICVAAPVLAFVAVNPVLQMGFNDDWGFIHMARVLAETGRVAYERWTTPMSVPHVFWGAAIIRGFGFSFFLLRLSILPFWAACGLLVYLLGRRIGLSPSYSAVASLSTMLSPVAIPLGTSFHSDITALALVLTTMYCGMRALQSASSGNTVGWLGGAIAAGALAGMTRDVYWAVPAWTVAAVILLRWRDRGLRITGTALLAVVLLGAVGSMWWHNTQPNAPGLDAHWEVWSGTGKIATLVGYMVLTAGLMCVPVLVSLGRSTFVLRGWSARITFGLLGAIASTAVWRPIWYMAPWLGNIFTEYGGFKKNQLLIGDRPVILQLPARFVLGCTVFIALAVCLGALIQACAKYRGRLREDIAAREPLLTFAVMTVPFAAGYIALLALRGSDSLYDRYLLPVAVIAALLAGGLATCLGKDKPGFASAVTLLILTSFGIANTHDFYATHRATLDLAQSLTNHGVPRHSVSGGYEYDGWTQLEEKGLMAPPPEPGLPAARSLPERIWYMPMTDVVVPCYYIVSSPQTDAGAIVRKIDYPAWLSPGTRSLWIQRAAGRSAANCGDLPARNAIAHR